jgi:hypothetical protein
MKTLFLMTLLVLVLVGFSQSNLKDRIYDIENSIVKLISHVDSIDKRSSINQTYKENKTLTDKIQAYQEDIYNAKLEILSIKDKIIDSNSEFERKRTNLFTKYFELWAIIGGLISIFGFRYFNKKIISQEIAKLTRTDVGYIRNNLDDFIKHTNLKKDSKIIVLCKNGKFDRIFQKVMKLFHVDVEEIENRIEISDIPKISQEQISTLKKNDVVIIENFDENDFWDIKNAEISKAFIELSNEIASETSIIYFAIQGTGNFPTNFVKSDKRHLISYANTPSQLYGNLLNMLKFRNELGYEVM